ncbi:MAG: type III pantothenate kinase [Proteobacteria bacterium]|nr:type III pantothenate kinase [Pseudomonadota bacterium]
MNKPYTLLVDIGNTFVKWGRYRMQSGTGAHESCIESGHALLEEIPALAAQLRKNPAPTQIVISNVAGTRVRATMLRLLEIWPDAPPAHWVIPKDMQCGVRNGYRNPAQLGSDRWAAMIGARSLHPARAVLVVCCGTATTVDLLTAQGRFAGGCIMPGVGTMLRSLHEKTAALPDADGVYTEYPIQTVDAIVSGCQHAQAGAVERIYDLYRRDHSDLLCLVSGGAAKALTPHLAIVFRYHDNLVLEGLYCISQALIREPCEG